MITLDDLEKLKREVERRQQDKDRAEGALAQIMSRLKSEFGVSSLKEAKIQLAKLEAKERRLAVEYTNAKKAFEASIKGGD